MRKLKLLLLAALMLSVHFSWAQTHEVTGRVADDKGNPLSPQWNRRVRQSLTSDHAIARQAVLSLRLTPYDHLHHP